VADVDSGSEVGVGFGGAAGFVVDVRWLTMVDGSSRRIDTVLGKSIVDHKFYAIDTRLRAALRRALLELVSQLEGYRGSPDTPQDAALAVHFGLRPSSDAIRQFVEDYLSERGISVFWGE